MYIQLLLQLRPRGDERYTLIVKAFADGDIAEAPLLALGNRQIRTEEPIWLLSLGSLTAGYTNDPGDSSRVDPLHLSLHLSQDTGP